MQLKVTPTVFIIANFLSYTPTDNRNPKMWNQVHNKYDGVNVFVKFVALGGQNYQTLVSDQNDQNACYYVKAIRINCGNAYPAKRYCAYFASLDGHYTKHLNQPSQNFKSRKPYTTYLKKLE